MEANYQQGRKGGFSRKRGIEIEVPAFSQLSLAPEIEHTLSPNLAFILGAWFTVKGKNSPAFRTYFLNALWIF
jgi:hypothetical protein